MTAFESPSFGAGDRAVTITRLLKASPERVFSAWTDPEQLLQWWGPPGVECTEAEVELSPGGRYRLANVQPDGAEIWITGVFLEIVRPTLLHYTWTTEPVTDSSYHSEVTVTFEEVDDGTKITVLHERIADDQIRASHGAGWAGCLSGLTELLAGSTT